MRVSERFKYDLSQSRVENSKEDNAKMLEQVSTQKRINHLSDNPIDNAQVIRQRGRLVQSQQLLKNIDYASGYLERTESAVRGIGDYLLRAKELSVAMANDTYGPSSREGTAQEIKQIVEGVVSLANTSFGNRYVFGGFRTQTPPISRDGQYLGDDGSVFIQISEGTFKQVNIDARGLFEAGEKGRNDGHFDMIHTLDILYTGLKDNDVPMIRTAMEELDHQLDKVSSFQARIGSIQNTLGSMRARLESGTELTTADISRMEDADLFKTSSELKRTESVFQSTLMATTKLLQPSLLNFLQ